MGNPWEDFKKTEGSADFDQGPWSEFSNSPKHSATAAAGMHAISGATAGFSDELSGLGEAAGRAIGLDGVGSRPALDVSRAKGGPTLDWETLRDAYKMARDHERKTLEEQSKEHPMASGAGELAGMVASPLNKLAGGMSVAKGGAVLGGINGLGSSEAEDVGGMAKDTAIGTVGGALLGKGAEKAAPVAQWAGKKLGGLAEKMVVNATGATGKQASEFAPTAGRELLDQGLVKFGDHAGNIAGRAEGALNSANADIDSALKALDSKGVTASADNVVKELQSQIAELEKDASQSGVVRKLKGVVDDIISTGESNIPVSAGEQTKRGFNKMAGNWMDPEAGQAGKAAYQAYRGEVEGAAKAADSTLAQKFIEGKKAHGLLAPIQEAADRRASTNSQQQIGNLVDATAGLYGLSDPDSFTGKAALAVAGRRLLLPRVAASGAVTVDKVSKMMLGSPQFKALASKSPQAFTALANKFTQKLSGGAQALPRAASNDRPVPEEEAKQKYVEGN